MISVIVPVYNVLEYLDRCISSIVCQSYENLEIILVDDGSTDGSGDICDSWGRRDPRIKVIHKVNGGLSDARNAGIDVASGEYISFIDSDDFVLKDYFQYLYDLIVSVNADMSVCQVINVDESDKTIHEPGLTVDKVIRGNTQCMDAFLSDASIDTTAWRKLYRKSLFSDSAIRYPVGRYHEDVFTTYKLVARCEVIIVGHRGLYAYRQRVGSIINSTFSPKHFDAVYGNIERYEFISNRYPELKSKASRGLIHSANICSMRMGMAKVSPEPYLPTMDLIYKTHLTSYLRSTARPASKIFAIAARINLRLLISAISKLS